jgi:hypothetical protein
MLGRIALGLVTGYVALVVAALLGAPNVAAPFLPQPAQAPSEAHRSDVSAGIAQIPTPAPASPEGGEAALLAAPLPAPGHSAATVIAPPAAQPAPATAAQQPVVAQQPTAVPAPTAQPAAQATTSGKSLTAPGQSNRPTAPQHP